MSTVNRKRLHIEWILSYLCHVNLYPQLCNAQKIILISSAKTNTEVLSSNSLKINTNIKQKS